jgi:dTDP-4-dehydrorhamnose reductase
MKFLVFGGNSLVGKELQAAITQHGHTCIATYRNNNAEGKITCDILKYDDLKRAFEHAKPDVVINSTNLAGGVDFCENNADLAKAFHCQANKDMANLAKEYGARLVLISTDYVFDGTKPPYGEGDATNPLNVYGREKLCAENYILETLGDKGLVARTTNVYGWDPHTKTPNFLIGIYPKLKAGEAVNVPSFLFGNPTLAEDLATAIVELCEKEANGIYHVVGPDYINRFTWAKRYAEVLGFDPALINEVPNPPAVLVPRPFKSHLSIDKLRAAITTPMRGVEEGLQAFKEASLQSA